jgi:segregation and condensation protein B
MDEDLTILEAALYVAGRPLALEELAGIIGKAESTAIKLLENLMYEYDKRKGALEVVLLPRARYVLQLRPELTPRVGKLIPGGLLAFSTLQTLVFIAMNWWRRSSLRQSPREGASYSARVPSSQTTSD